MDNFIGVKFSREAKPMEFEELPYIPSMGETLTVKTDLRAFSGIVTKIEHILKLNDTTHEVHYRMFIWVDGGSIAHNLKDSTL